MLNLWLSWEGEQDSNLRLRRLCVNRNNLFYLSTPLHHRASSRLPPGLQPSGGFHKYVPFGFRGSLATG